MVFEYNGNDLGSGSGSIPASDFTLTLTNARLTSSAQTGGLTIVTGGTATAPTIRVSSYPANPSDSGKEYTITLTATDIYGKTLTKSVTIEQEADTYTFTITPNPNTVGAFDTTAVFTVTTNNINNVGISAYDSGITGRTYSNNTLTTNFSTNSGTSSRSMEISLTGKTAAGRTITRSAEISQSGGGAANLNIVYNGGATRVSQVGLDTNDFTITANNVVVTGYSATNGADIRSSGATSVTVRIPANQTDNEMSYKVIVSGTNQYDQTTVSAATIVYQSSDEYTLKLVPSATSVEFTSTGYTFDIVSSNVTGIVVSSHEGTTSETISGSQLVLGYDMNDSTTSRSIIVSLSGTTSAGRPVSCSAVITQSGESGLELSIDYTGETLPAAGGSTDKFLVTAGENVYNIGFSVDVPGATVINVGGGVVLVYEGNQSSSQVTYTVTVTGMTPTRNVSDSCTVTQEGDTFAFELQPVLNPISADATSAGFNLTATSVNSIGYYIPESLNITGISGLSQNSVTATGISVNTGSSSKTIRLVLSGTTVGGRTVYATGTTIQSTAEIASITITYNGTMLPASSGSTNDFTVTSVNARVTGYTVSPSPASASTTGETSLTMDYPQNPSTSSTVSYYITPVGVHLQTGVQVVGNTCEVVQGTDTDWSFSVSPDSGNIPWDAVATSFTAVYTNVSEIGYHSGTNINSYTKSGDIYSVVITENPGHTSRSIEITLSGKTPGGNVVYASGTLTQGAKPYSPDIWWTKTSEGQKSTEVTSVNDVPAFVAGTYDGRNVVYTIYINYNSDVTGVSLSESWLISGVSATRDGKTVSISVPANEHTIQRRVGEIAVTGTAPNGSTASSTLTVVQVGGVVPLLTIVGEEDYEKTSGPAAVVDEEYHVEHDFVDTTGASVVYIQRGNFTSVVLNLDEDPENDQYVNVSAAANTGETLVTSSFKIVATTVYGNAIQATFTLRQHHPALLGNFNVDLSKLYSFSDYVTTIVNGDDLSQSKTSHVVTFSYDNLTDTMQCELDGDFLNNYADYGFKIVKNNVTIADVVSNQKITITAGELKDSTWYLYDYKGVVYWVDNYGVNHRATGGQTEAKLTCKWGNLESLSGKTISFTSPTSGCIVYPVSVNTEEGTVDVTITFGTNETDYERIIILNATGVGPDGVTKTATYSITQITGEAVLEWNHVHEINLENGTGDPIQFADMSIVFQLDGDNSNYEFKWDFSPVVNVPSNANVRVRGENYVTTYPSAAGVIRNKSIRTSVVSTSLEVYGVPSNYNGAYIQLSDSVSGELIDVYLTRDTSTTFKFNGSKSTGIIPPDSRGVIMSTVEVVFY